MIFIGLGLVLFGASSMKSLQTRKTEKVPVVSGCGLCGRHGGPVLCFLFASLISTRVKSIKARSRQQKRTVDLLKDLKRQKMPQFCRLAAHRVLFSKSLIYGPRCPMWFTSSSVCASWPSTWYTASPGTSSWTRPFVCMFATFSLPSRPLNVFSMWFETRLESDLHKAAAEMLLDTKLLLPTVSECFRLFQFLWKATLVGFWLVAHVMAFLRRHCQLAMRKWLVQMPKRRPQRRVQKDCIRPDVLWFSCFFDVFQVETFMSFEQSLSWPMMRNVCRSW